MPIATRQTVVHSVDPLVNHPADLPANLLVPKRPVVAEDHLTFHNPEYETTEPAGPATIQGSSRKSAGRADEYMVRRIRHVMKVVKTYLCTTHVTGTELEDLELFLTETSRALREHLDETNKALEYDLRIRAVSPSADPTVGPGPVASIQGARRT
jgi:hypothetical protein